MNMKPLIVLAILCSTAHTVRGQEPGTTAFVDVNVLTMESERVLTGQTVLIAGDRISAIGPSDEIEVPDGAEIIDGHDGYLMPGLADMHMHMAGFNTDPGHLVLYLAEGTTTVRSLSEAPAMFDWRHRVKNGTLLGPTIYNAGRVIVGNHENFLGFGLYVILFRGFVFLLPFLIGGMLYFLWPRFRNRRTLLIGVPSVMLISLILTLSKTPPFMTIAPVIMPDLPYGYMAESSGQAVEEVRNQHRVDVDLVKLYDGLTEEQFLAAAAEAKDLGMYVISHLPDQMQLETILRSGTDEIAHIDEFNMFHWKGTRDQIMANFQKGIDPEIDYTLIQGTVEMVRKNGISVVSNMSADEVTYKLIFDTPGMLGRPEYRVIRPDVLDTWRTSGRPVTSFADQGPYREMEMDFLKALIKSMHEADIIVTIGTDSSDLVEGTLPNHIHRELELLVEAGLSNFEALEAGTKNAALIVNKMGRNGDFGTIARGERADLILLADNPLENVSHTRNRIGVMARGRWFTQNELDRMVDGFVAGMQGSVGPTASN